MNHNLSSFAARLREQISDFRFLASDFPALALELFALQFKHNAAYRNICSALKLTPESVEHSTQIPAVPTSAFKELEITCLLPCDRTAVFHSSGTTEQNPSRHFHSAESLAVYEASLWTWFACNLSLGTPSTVSASFSPNQNAAVQLVLLTPPPALAQHSSLVHMFETVRHKLVATPSASFGRLAANAPKPPNGTPSTVSARPGSSQNPAISAPGLPPAFVGRLAEDGTWTLDFAAAMSALGDNPDSELQSPKLILGTAFSFVHLLDYLAENNVRFQLPGGSRVMETGGYKNRSRTMPKAELHALITRHLGIAPENIICEYGMSELSSQAYDSNLRPPSAIGHPRAFHFPPWARAQIISPETGREVAEGETGLIRILDLANVFSVAAIQTGDLGIRRGDGFELIGRAQLAEPRGCSLMVS